MQDILIFSYLYKEHFRFSRQIFTMIIIKLL